MNHWYGTKSEILLMVPICENSRSLPINWNGIVTRYVTLGCWATNYILELFIWAKQYEIGLKYPNMTFDGPVKYLTEFVTAESRWVDSQFFLIKLWYSIVQKVTISRFLDYLSKIRYCIWKMRLCLLDREKNRVQLINKSLDQSI